MAKIISDYTIYILTSTVVLLILALLVTSYKQFTCSKCCEKKLLRPGFIRPDSSNIVRDDYYETTAMCSNYVAAQSNPGSNINVNNASETAEYAEINRTLKKSGLVDLDYYNHDGTGLYVNPALKKLNKWNETHHHKIAVFSCLNHRVCSFFEQVAEILKYNIGVTRSIIN